MGSGQDVLRDPLLALGTEWLLGNGLGGSASGGAAGIPARRGHAVLVAGGPHGRTVTLLAAIDERLLAEEGTPGAAGAGDRTRPAGQARLEEFRLDPWPVWRFRAGCVSFEKSLFLIYAHNAAVISYRHLDGPGARLTASPLLPARDAERGAEPQAAARVAPGRVRIESSPGRPALTLWHDGTFMPARARRRLPLVAGDGGAEAGEEAFVPGYVEALLAPGASLHLIASAEEDLLPALAREDRLGQPPPRTLAACVAALAADERARRATWRRAALAAARETARQAHTARRGADAPPPAGEPSIDGSDPWTAPLAEALQWGPVRRGARVTLVASLPLAAERPVETLRAVAGMIALRGFETARDVLRGYVEYLDEGLAPDGFDPDDGRPRYGDPAPSLWLVIGAERYARRSGDLEFARETLYPALEGVMHFYRSGTRHGIHVGPDGLLACGEGDAARRPADINALWYHALAAMAQLARATGHRESAAFYLAWANEQRKRFNQALWDDPRGRPFLALDARGPTPGLAPRQLFAASLSPPLLPPERAASLVAAVERELFTPFGLRESARSDTVATAWLGPFHSAYLRAGGRGAEAQARVRAWLADLRRAVDAAAPGRLPEAFALAPEAPAGTLPARSAGDAVSILAAAELLRVWIEELDHAPDDAPGLDGTAGER